MIKALLTLALLTSTLVAQPWPSQGSFRGTQMWLKVDDGLQSTPLQLKRSVLYAKAGGMQEGPPGAVANTIAGFPDFRLQTMFPQVPTAGPYPKVNCFSNSVDWINSTDDGVLFIPQFFWAAVFFSVIRDGVANNSVIGREYNLEEGAHADLFSHVFEESTFAKEYKGTFKAANSDQINVMHMRSVSSSTKVNDGELIGFDPVPIGIFPPTLKPAYVFAVSKDTLQYTPDNWWPGTTVEEQRANRSSASLLRMKWSGTSWSRPQVFISWDKLGPTIVQTDELDAVAVDPVGGFVVFSRKMRQAAEPGFEPMMIAILDDNEQVTKVRVYRDALGVPLSQKIGLTQGDDFDAFCFVDPRVPNVDMNVGIPQVEAVAGPTAFPDVRMVVRRIKTAAGGDAIEVVAYNWHGGAPSDNSFMSLIMTLNGGTPTVFQTQPRDRNDTDISNPIRFVVPLPVLVDPPTIVAKFQALSFNATSFGLGHEFLTTMYKQDSYANPK